MRGEACLVPRPFLAFRKNGKKIMSVKRMPSCLNLLLKQRTLEFSDIVTTSSL